MNGLQFSQQYLCVSEEQFQGSLRLYLVHQYRVKADLTKSHVFVGYCPLVFAIRSKVLPAESSSIELILSDRSLNINEFFPAGDAIARLRLQKISLPQGGDESIVFYEGRHGIHRFLPSFNQMIIRLLNRLYGRKPGNVYLEGNLLSQVQIAYAISRKVCLISPGRE